MKEPYGGAVATSTDPQLCVGGRKGADEALAGARAGGTLSREIDLNSGVPTPFPGAEGNTGRVDSARYDRTPRGLRPPHARKLTGQELGYPASNGGECRRPRRESIGERRR